MMRRLIVFYVCLLGACGTDSSGNGSSSSGASSSGASSSGAASGGSSGGSSGASSSGSTANACELPFVEDAGTSCTTKEECVVRMTGNRCCPQIAQAMNKSASDANPIPTGGTCDCPPTPCAPPPVPTAECSDAGACVAVY